MSATAYKVIFPKDPAYVPETPDTEPTGYEVDFGELTISEGIAQEAEKMELKRHLYSCWCADYLTAHPQTALQTAKAYVKKFVGRQDGSQRFFKEWEKILNESTIEEICAVLRDRSEAKDQLRLCSPFFGVMPHNERLRILETVYGTESS